MTTIHKIESRPGQRLLVVSDIHGHLNRLAQLLRKMNYGGDDILIIVGDLIDKGPESLRVVRYVIDLCRQRPVYVSMGNVEQYRLQMFQNAHGTGDARREFAEYLQWSAKAWGSSLFQEMLSDLGVPVSRVTAENAAGYISLMGEQFREELEFLRSRPTILTAGSYLFVHGGVPTDDLSALAGTDAVPYLKNDDFLGQGYSFQNYTVVTGHWPTCLYRRDEENVSPLLDRERRILCIDGGCGLKYTGQLNGVMIPGSNAEMEEITWTSYDDFQVVTAADAQSAQSISVHVQYFDSAVEVLEEKGDMGRVRQLSSGREFDVPLAMVKRWGDGRLHCSDYCDCRLAVEPGEQLSVILETEKGRYVKKRGEIGWYGGAVLDGKRE